MIKTIIISRLIALNKRVTDWRLIQFKPFKCLSPA